MKPSRILIVVPVAAALTLGAAVASGQTSTGPVNPKKVSASTTPKRDRFRPYDFTTRGKISLPKTRPLNCPPGNTNPAYCTPATKKQMCTGKVSIRFERSGNTISSRRATVQDDCTYRSTVSFASRRRRVRGSLDVHVRFQGNKYLNARSASTETVRAG